MKVKLNLQAELLDMKYTEEGFVIVQISWINPECRHHWTSWMLEEMFENLLSVEERQKLEAFVKARKEN